MMTPRFLSLLFFIACLFPNAFSQKEKDYLGLSKFQIKQLNTVELIKGDKTFPESYLFGMHGDSLILLTDISGWNEKSLFAKSKISIAGYDELIISSKAERRRKSLFWGTLIGAASFAIGQKTAKTKSYEQTVGKSVLGQRPHSGYIEGTIAGITGFGLGMIIGQMTAKRKINLRKQKRKALKQLKAFSYK